MQERIELKDGREVFVRALQRTDLEGLLTFFSGLPEEDRVFLRMDVTDRAMVERRLQETQEGKAHRLVVTSGSRIVAYGVLEREGNAWQEHVGEMRLIVGRDYQRSGLGMHLARELYLLGVREKIEVIMARFMAPQEAARRILERLGFVQEAVLKDRAKDQWGRRQDLVMMRCDLQTLLHEMKEYFEDFDWQRVR